MAKRTGNKIESTWREIFKEKDAEIESALYNKGYFDITAQEIKQLTGAEARLVTKFDHKSKVPDLFEQRNLSILSIENGRYRLACTDPFIPVNTSGIPYLTRIKTSTVYSLTTIGRITSEADALNTAYASGVFHFIKVWLTGESSRLYKTKNNQERLWAHAEKAMYQFHQGVWKNATLFSASSLFPTATGRRSAQPFSFTLPDIQNRWIDYPVKGTQIEIDSGLESMDSILLIEAKMGNVETITMRQVLYPFFHYHAALNKITHFSVASLLDLPCPHAAKNIYPLLMMYDGALEEMVFFSLRYREDGALFMAPLPFVFVVKHQGVASKDIDIVSDVSRIPVNTEVCRYDIPYPQADSIPRIITTLLALGHLEETESEKITDGFFSKEDIFENQDISPRQQQYYINALIWLDFVRKPNDVYDRHDKNKYRLTQEGRALINKNASERLRWIYKKAAHDPLFNFAIQGENRKRPFDAVINDIVNRIPRSDSMSYKTRVRRWQSIKRWADYLYTIDA